MRRILNFTSVFAAFSLIACGGGSDSTAPSSCTSSATQGCVSASGSSFSPTSVTISASGQVTWTFVSGGPHNVTFSGSAPSGGNIANSSSGTASRTFGAAGTFSYTCTNHPGMSGSVVVQ